MLRKTKTVFFTEIVLLPNIHESGFSTPGSRYSKNVKTKNCVLLWSGGLAVCCCVLCFVLLCAVVLCAAVCCVEFVGVKSRIDQPLR